MAALLLDVLYATLRRSDDRNRRDRLGAVPQIVVLDIDAPRAQTALVLAGIVLIFGTTTAAPRRRQC
ncbi:hypothetical protein ACLBYD_26585 [Rhodococcus sp. C26F]